jgi:predicted nucleic acid-binding protein
MKIMLDANIIVSAILFPQSSKTKALEHIVSNYNLVLSQYAVDETEKVFSKKIPHELYLLKEITDKYPDIRDVDDLPVLANAIESNVDILITGDKESPGHGSGTVHPDRDARFQHTKRLTISMNWVGHP